MSRANAVSAQAHIGEASVKAARAAGRSQNKIRESIGITLLPPAAAPDDGEE